MKTNTLILLLQLAGLLHLGLLCAGLLMPRAVNLRAHLATLPPFVQRLFWVYYAFIGLCIVSFGLVSVTFASTLASGGGLARAVCAFLAVFWTIRLIAAVFIFDVRPYLASEAGQFRLVPLDGGRKTLLEGTTWYRHHMWPAEYWAVWSDHIIHTIHLRVLNHVKQLSEKNAP